MDSRLKADLDRYITRDDDDGRHWEDLQDAIHAQQQQFAIDFAAFAERLAQAAEAMEGDGA
jgi:hypothetical protein